VVGDVVQALPDSLIHIGACGDVGAISFAGCFAKPLDERGTSAFSGVNCPRRFLATEEKLGCKNETRRRSVLFIHL